jgi:hypothetical protein
MGLGRGTLRGKTKEALPRDDASLSTPQIARYAPITGRCQFMLSLENSDQSGEIMAHENPNRKAYARPLHVGKKPRVPQKVEGIRGGHFKPRVPR